MGLRDDILAAVKLPVTAVQLPAGSEGWPESVRIKTMTGLERDAWEESTMVRRGGEVSTRMDNFRANLLVKVIVDENGNRVFNDIDAPALGRTSSVVLDLLFAEACRLNGIGRKDVEELAKN